jgi:hypothetical protein
VASELEWSIGGNESELGADDTCCGGRKVWSQGKALYNLMGMSWVQRGWL